ncbi:MAG: hypothetical protein ACEQSA_00710 [Weeksellaceae bacterium]
MLKPYLIIPRFIEQPTWGGTYIAGLKHWENSPVLTGKKIGQSYELSGDINLAKDITDTRSSEFQPEVTDASGKPTTSESYLNLTELTQQDPETILGTNLKDHTVMPLLIKLNQAAGNSFQLHVKPGQQHERWQPKPESWYFLEDGYISCGVNPDKNVENYKKCCLAIEALMKDLSQQVQAGTLTIAEARAKASDFITLENPWQYINLFDVKKYDLIDLSEGGVHHSWEENANYPMGNVVYEVQLDVMDPYCTIRSFDQGKMKDDGSIREIHIEDYFTFIETDKQKNDINYLKRTAENEKLLKTPYYSLDCVTITGNQQLTTENSFHHLYVRDGEIDVKAGETVLHLTQGHSCFIPAGIKTYELISVTPESVVLKTYV